MVRFFSHGAILAGVVLVSILLSLTGCYIDITEGGRSPAWSSDGNKIVFVYYAYDRGNTSDIRVMNVDGSNLTILLKNAQSPSWSPDGSKIACVFGQEGKNDVWAVNANGSNSTCLTDNGASGSPV